MSEDLDRRIAIEVMGEEEPPPCTEHFNAGIRVHSLVFRENWFEREIWTKDMDFVRYGWQPAPFSSVLEEALRAVDRYFAETQPKDSLHEPEMFMEYRPTANVLFCASLDGEFGLGQTLPEAICNLLLALQTEKK